MYIYHIHIAPLLLLRAACPYPCPIMEDCAHFRFLLGCLCCMGGCYPVLIPHNVVFLLQCVCARALRDLFPVRNHGNKGTQIQLSRVCFSVYKWEFKQMK